MKKIFLAIVLALVLSAAGAGSALASDGEGEHCASGQAFGQHHAEMARAGMLGGDHNPGDHQGYSHCLP